MLLYQDEYRNMLSDLVQAHKELDRLWFIKNKDVCKQLMSHWLTKYCCTGKAKYKRATKKLEHLLKMTNSEKKWGFYIRELLTT